MVLVWHTGPAINLGSGLLMAALGLLLIRADPRRDWNRIFALLAVFWGIQIVTQNLVLLVSDRLVADVAGRISLAFLIPLYFFVVAFASVYPRPRPPFGTNAWWLVLLMVPGASTLLVLVFDPGAILGGIVPEPDGGAFTMRWGPLFPYLVVAPLYAGFLYALFVMTRRLDEASSTIERRQIGFVLAALVLFVAYNVPLQLLIFGGRALGLASATEAQQREAAVIGLVMLLGLVLLAYLGARLVQGAVDPHRARDDRGEPRILLGILVAALAIGTTEGIVILVQGPALYLVGVVRLVAVALIVYAIARYQLFDIHLRIRMGAATLSTVLVVGSVGAALWIMLRIAGTPSGTGTAGAIALAVVLFVPALRLAGRFADRIAPPGDARELLFLRKLEVYRATVESLQGHGPAPEPHHAALVTLRAKLGLSEADHGAVTRLMQDRREPETVDLRPGSRAFGRYEIGEMLGEGAVGRVFRAHDTLLGRSVVIKELLTRWRNEPRLVQMLLREAKIAGQLHHPNLAAVYDVERHGDDQYLIMEHVDGGTLAERLRDAPMPPDETRRVIAGVLAGLGAAHARGIVHRDVKPENVLLGLDGSVKLTDFGVADLEVEPHRQTLVGLPEPSADWGQVGTLAFMAPEQAAGEPATAASDVYAVGAVLFLMLTGQQHLDLTGCDELEARRRVAAAKAPSRQALATVPVAWRPVVARALAPVPADRFPAADAFAEALPEP